MLAALLIDDRMYSFRLARVKHLTQQGPSDPTARRAQVG